MARPRTARFRASAPKGARTGCPRLIFEAGCLVRSAPGPGTADARGYSRHPGRAFFWLLFFARAKKSNPGCGAGASRIQTDAARRAARSVVVGMSDPLKFQQRQE